MIEFIIGIFVCAIAFMMYQKMNSKSSHADVRSTSLYQRNYASTRSIVPLPSHTEARGAAQGMPQCKFFLSAKSQLQRDYVLIVDRSGSMSTGRRWDEACAAVRSLAPYVCKFDPDGIMLMFFDHSIEKFDNVRTKEEVEKAFSKYKPRGSTDLALALHHAFVDHFSGTRGATTILVVTDGCPNSQSEVERVLRRAANSIEQLDELSVSFVQIGDDPSATKFLEHLDDTLDDVKYDVVDTITAEECARISFSELVARSIFD